MNFTQEQLTKAKAAKSVEELLAIAKENGMELSEEEAKKFFVELHKEGELSDDELNNVSGGVCDDDVLEEHETLGSWGYECRFFVLETGARSDYQQCANCAHFTVKVYDNPLGEGWCHPMTNQ